MVQPTHVVWLRKADGDQCFAAHRRQRRLKALDYFAYPYRKTVERNRWSELRKRPHQAPHHQHYYYYYYGGGGGG